MVGWVVVSQIAQQLVGRVSRFGAMPSNKKRRGSSLKGPPTAPPQRRRFWLRSLILGTEIVAFLIAALFAVILGLGHATEWFAGAGLWSNLVPFAACILAMLVAGAVLFRLWLPLRAWLMTKAVLLPATIAVLAAVGAWRLSLRADFDHQVESLRTLVGGSAEAERNTIAHQVFAAYRRSDLTQMQRILDRAGVFEPTILEAAKIYAIDPEILIGIGATESSFYPHDSKDGGRGLFQLTSPPQVAIDLVRKRLGVSELDPLNQRHNALVAAATMRHYLGQMHGDLFLGLLAYNIGPKNGGLRSIMKQYGARDFVTIQPYLQNLPRDYPVRVLSAALAYRVWRLEGKLPRYEEGANAVHIQGIGIPGLHDQPKSDRVLLRQDHPAEAKSAKPVL